MDFFDAVALPSLLAFSAGLFVRVGVRAFRLQRYGRCVIFAAFAVAISVVLWASANNDPRSPSIIPIAVIGITLGFAIMSLIEDRIPLVGVVLPVGIIALLILGVEFLTAGFKTSFEPGKEVMSPDGRYKAQLFYFGGWTPDAYFIVCLKSNSPFAQWEGADEITGGEVEGVTDISWRDNHTIAFRYRSGTFLSPNATQWRDVSIRYEPQVTSN